MPGMCIQTPALQTGKERLKGEEYTVREAGEKVKERWGSQLWPTLDSPLCAELSDALGHVQRGQHLLKNGSFHIGPSQVGFL